MTFNFMNFYDFGHYGIFDEPDMFYPEVRDLLQKALDSGEDFDTGWGGFKKELQSIRIHAVGDVIRLEVSQSMDDMPELIFDCSETDDLTDDEVEVIIDAWDLSDYTTDTYAEASLQRNSSIADIVKAATKLANECNEFLEEGYAFVVEMIGEIKKARDKNEARSN